MSPALSSQLKKGFTLVITISLLVLLTLIAIGLLSLSSVTLRASSSQQLAQEARQNARLALMLAIGQLQSTAGPDQRITAPASVLANRSAQPHLTGVWQGWKWDGTGSPNVAERKQSLFQQWLISSPAPDATRTIGYHSTPVSGKNAVLVRGRRDPSLGDQVNAPIVPIRANQSNQEHGYAWAVFDESTKLPLALPTPQNDDLISSLERMTAAPLPGYEATTQRNWSALGANPANRAKLVTTNQSELAGLQLADRSFHDLTSRSAGVLANAAAGGLAQDLSRVFSDRNNLPGNFGSRFLYSGTTNPLVPAPSRFSGANPLPSPDPTWRLLHSHYRLYDQVTGNLDPSIACTNTARPAPGTSGSALLQHPYFNTQQLVPVIAKAQFVFSMSFGWHNSLNTFARTGNSALPDNDPNKDHYITWLVVDPVITLWNPYNVKLRFTGGRIDLYRVPLAFRLYKNGALINANYTHMANCFVTEDFAGRGNTYYRLNLLPPQGQNEIVLAPGEHVVLTASNHVKNFNNQFSVQGVNLRPGFFPPAGNASNRLVGGISTMNVCVSPTGANNGQIYGKSVRSIPVKAGDRIQVEVRQERASVDRPTETGGKEVTGYMKYYVGNPDSPTRVGGIELDYGTQESQYLPSYQINDMPTFVVGSDIPRLVQADNYVGNTPPVVRFKEPFLISTFQLKTERDSKFPSRSWIHNAPTNLYASAGIDQTEPWPHHQYELQWEVMTDWPPASPTIEISNTNNRGYGGSGIYAQSGLEFATHSTIPLAPAASLAQFRHAPLNVGGQLPLVSQIVANSFPPPVIPTTAIRSISGTRTLLDHSYYANNALFDGFFLSTLTEPGGPLSRRTPLRTALTDFFDRYTPLPSARFLPYRRGMSAQDITTALTAPDGHLKSAAHLLIDSPLNVNSTRVDVWEAILNSTYGQEIPLSQNNSISTAVGENSVFSRHLPTNQISLEEAKLPMIRDLAKWNGYRRLTPVQIRRLAEEIVMEIQKRGPFQSVAEFVNRRPGSDELAQSGALQAAIDRSGINQAALNPNFAVGRGNTADGSPGILTQADLLTPLAPILTARGDTFRIRAYGEAGPANGTKVTAWCEAIVQRVPEYVDGTDQPWVTPTLSINNRFGRRYQIVSFRWLTASEI